MRQYDRLDEKLFNCDCNYCKNHNFIGEIDNKIWIEIPKNGSYGLKTNKKTTNVIQEDKISKYENVLIIVRDPIERFKSLCAHYFIDGTRKNDGLKWLNNYDLKNIDADNIVKNVLDNFNKIQFISEPHHWNSQTSFIPTFTLEKNVIIYELNDLSNIFNIKKTNKSLSNNIKIDDKSKNKIMKLYSKDVTLYNKHIL